MNPYTYSDVLAELSKHQAGVYQRQEAPKNDPHDPHPNLYRRRRSLGPSDQEGSTTFTLRGA